MTAGRQLRATGLDLLIGLGVTQQQLIAALQAIFALPPDAIVDRDDPQLWRAIDCDGWATFSAITCPKMFSFAVSLDEIGHRIDWIAALHQLAARLDTVVLWPEEDGAADHGWAAVQPDGRILGVDVAPPLYDVPDDWDEYGV